MLCKGFVGLGELEPLGKIRVVIDLLVKGAQVLDLTIKGQADKTCLFKDLPAQDRQGAGHPEADRTDIGVGVIAGSVGAVAEQFGG
jgi:hypothetical protein